jgi:hypothetical protein
LKNDCSFKKNVMVLCIFCWCFIITHFIQFLLTCPVIISIGNYRQWWKTILITISEFVGSDCRVFMPCEYRKLGLLRRYLYPHVISWTKNFIVQLFLIIWKSINWQGTFEQTGTHPMGHNPWIGQETPVWRSVLVPSHSPHKINQSQKTYLLVSKHHQITGTSKWQISNLSTKKWMAWS